MKEITALNKALADFNSYQTAVDKIMAAESVASIRESAASYNAVSEAAKLADELAGTSYLKSAAETLAEMEMASVLRRESLFGQAVKEAASSQSLWDKTMAAASASSVRESAAALAVASKGIDARNYYEAFSGAAKRADELAGTSYLKSAAETLAEMEMASVLRRESLFGQAVKEAASSQSLWDKTMAANGSALAIRDIANALPKTSYLSLAEKAIDIIRSSRNVFLEDSTFLSEMAESVSSIKIDFNSINTENLYELEAIFDRDSQELSTAQNINVFIQKFKNSRPFLQTVIYFLIIQIFLPQLNSISANLLTPHAESCVSEKKLTDREKISKIKNIPLTINSINTSSLRFVTGNNVRLRRAPSTNSEIIDEMALGQVVTVLSKKRNWIEVQYEYKDGEVMTGWTFTTYTKRFVKLK